MLEVGRECKISRLRLVNDAVSSIVGRFAKMLRFSGVETPARYGKTLRTRSEQRGAMIRSTDNYYGAVRRQFTKSCHIFAV